MAPSRLVWKTEPCPPLGTEWTHADLACGIGGFSVAAHALGARTVWACDVDRMAVEAYNGAHSEGSGDQAKCNPIERRAL